MREQQEVSVLRADIAQRAEEGGTEMEYTQNLHTK